MKPVVFNPVALEDLEEISGYIAADNLVAAEDVREDILETAESLGHQVNKVSVLRSRKRTSDGRCESVI